MMQIRPAAVWMLLSSSLLLCTTLLAQENSGKILGTVLDVSGAAVPEAKIIATSPRVPRGIETTTDSLGNYVLPNLPIDIYTVTVSREGFATVKRSGIDVQLGSQITYNPQLSIGQVASTVEVTDTAISLDTTSARSATNITQSQFENLSRGRNFNSVLALAPGARQETKGGNAGVGGVSVDGASGSENAYIIDGVEVTDVINGSLQRQNSIPVEFVQEVQVKTGGFEAQYGGATGGVVNVATRGGSNQFHGDMQYLFTGDSLNASERGYWQRSPLDANKADFFKPKTDDYSLRYPGGALGGPMIKDKLFFFGAYMPEMEHTIRKVDYASGSRTFEESYLRHYALGRLDYAASAKLQINGTYLWSPAKHNGTLPNRDIRVAAPSNDLGIQGGYTPSENATTSATFTPTANTILQARYGYSYLNNKDAAFGNAYGNADAPYNIYRTASTAAGLPVPGNVAGGTGYSNVSNTLTPYAELTTRHNVYIDGTHIMNIHGQQHTFKAGWALNRVANRTLVDYTNGQFDIYWGDQFTREGIAPTKGTYGYYIWQDGVRRDSGVSGRNQGFYIQDTWRVSPRITINAGVRLESEFLPPYKQVIGGRQVANPISFNWGDKIAPRVGVAWDIFGDGKWKAAGSFGLFYDVMKYQIARSSFGGDIWVSYVYRLDNPNVLSLGKANPGALGSLITSYDNRTLPINAAGEIEGIDPAIKPTSTREFSFTLDHQLTNRLVAGVRYSRKDLLKVIEDIGVLDATGSEVYLTGNPGFGRTRVDSQHIYDAKTPNGQEFLVPKATRQYDGLEFRLQGQMKSTTFVASYTWSRLYGNYAGLANSDESGRSNPGVSRAYDLPYYYFDASGSQKAVEGPLGTDRPHTFKLFGSYDLKSKVGTTTFGLNQTAFSGTPDSTSVIYRSAPTYPFGRGDLGRTPFYTQTDLFVAHNIKATERFTVKLEADIRNLFNQAAVISRVTQLNRAGAISTALLPTDKFFAGYKPLDYVTLGGAVPLNPIYGLPAGNYRNGGGASTNLNYQVGSAFAATNPNFGAYQDFRVIRLGIRLLF